MAPSKALTTKVQSGSPYQLDPNQVLRAAKALVKHIKDETKRRETDAPKKNLLATADSDNEEEDSDVDPVWLVVGTKQHVVDKKKLKPGVISIPHSLNETGQICLITANPQRAYKDLIADSAFPSDLSSRITRVIDVEHLKKKYKAYEARRQLYSEHDIFLADKRVITFLTGLLGKTFYKSGAKRPIPVKLTGNEKTPKDAEGKQIKKPKGDKNALTIGDVAAVARDIEKALHGALIHLSPGVQTSVKVAKASWTPEKIAKNVQAVVTGLTEGVEEKGEKDKFKFITKGWRNVRGIYIKGPSTMSLPIWLADELWVSEDQVLEEAPAVQGTETKAIEDSGKESKASSKKRKSLDGVSTVEEEVKPAKKAKKADSQANEELAKDIAQRKEKLKKQKAEASAKVEIPIKALKGLDKSGAKETKKKKKSV